MAINQQYNAVRQFHALFRAGTLGQMTDGQLLERFVTDRGETGEHAFAVLVERHGPLVLRTCRGILGNDHDAQDAFQVAFLALVRKSKSLFVKDTLAPWLQQAAYHAARSARTAGLRRKRHEQRSAERTAARPPAPAPAEDCRAEAEALLHEEIARLPERYRVPLVICDLGGCTHEHAALQLGWPVGTVKSRLARGRERLRGRLTRRGLTLSAGLFIATPARGVNASALIDSIVAAATRIATTDLAVTGLSGQAGLWLKGVVTAMRHAKSKTLAVSLLVLAAAAGTGALVARTRASNTRPLEAKALPLTPSPPPPKDPIDRPVAQTSDAGSSAQASTPKSRDEVRHVHRLNVGPLHVDALAEAEIGVHFRNVTDPGLAIQIKAPEFVTVKNLRVFRRGATRPGDVDCFVSVVIDTKRASELAGDLTVRLGEDAARVPVVATIRPKAPEQPKVLVVSSGFGAASSNADYYRPWFDLIADAKVDVNYMEAYTGLSFEWRPGSDGRPALPDELARYDVILLADGGTVFLDNTSIWMLEKFVESGKRLIVTATPATVGTVVQANRILRLYGMEMLDEEAALGSVPGGITANVIVADSLTKRVATLSTFRPAPIEIKDREKARLLAPIPRTDKGFVAVSRPGKGEVIAVGVTLIPSWIGDRGKNTDNARFLKNLLTKPTR